MKRRIKLPKMSYKDKMIFFIKKCSKKWATQTSDDITEDPTVGKFYKFTGNGWNPDWGWVGLEKASIKELEDVYLRLYHLGWIW